MPKGWIEKSRLDRLAYPSLAEALGEIEVPPFELRLNGLGSFGGNKPRAIFVSVAPSEGLAALRRANERAARREQQRCRTGT